MADESKNSQDLLEQLKMSFSAEANNNEENAENNDSESLSGDDLQAELRSRFLNDSAESTDSQDDEYVIDEDFLQDALADEEMEEPEEIEEIDDIEEDDIDDIDDIDEDDFEEEPDFEEESEEELEEEFEDELDEEEIYEIDETEEFSEENIEEDDYGFYKDVQERSEEDASQKSLEEEAPYDQEASLDEGDQVLREGFEEGYQDNQEIPLYEGLEEIQEEEYHQADEEIYETEKDQEIQEDDYQSVPLIVNAKNDFFEGEDDIELNEIEELDDIDELDELYAEKDERSASEISEDNYVEMFYREIDPYENIPFKDRIVENAPTVDSLEATLNSYAEYSEDFTLEEFEEAESIPLVLDDDDIIEEIDEPEIEEPQSFADTSELDRSDLALLLEFGYKEELLQKVSDEDIEKISDEELVSNVSKKTNTDNFGSFSGEDENDEEDEEEENVGGEYSAERTKSKIQKQYDIYRKNRGGVLLRLIISSLFAVILFFYELIPALGVELGGVFNRERYFFAYALIGLQILIIVALPAIMSIYESVKKLITVGIDAYFIAGVSVSVTFIYDLIVIFERKEIPPTFHFCAAAVILLAELSELMRLNAEIKNYEYYFIEYIFEGDVEARELYKYTLVRSEGKGSVADKMYAGGLNTKTVIYSLQNVDSASGFFEASKVASKRNRFTFGWIIVSAVVAFILTIVSGIIYEQIWIAAAAFLISFNLSLPILALVTEWLPFVKLTSQNYAYGVSFASEGSLESFNRCDMLLVNDMHLFEKCDSKSVNLAIYDSTSKAVLLSCLNSVYSKIGGPLESAFANVKVQSIGECKVNRVARSGIEALVGKNYSVLIGDEQFMSRYGIFFPTASLGKEEDKIFTLCVSINNRATARIAVKYRINETFYSIAQKLMEDNINCTVQTYDPMISAELVARVRTYKGAPINIVHRSASDLALEEHGHKAGALYSVMGENLSVLARGSRLNLAVALSNSKKLRVLRKLLNVCSGALVSAGALTAMFLVLSEHLASVNWLVVLAYWVVSAAITVGLFVWKFPQKDRFIFRKKNSKDE